MIVIISVARVFLARLCSQHVLRMLRRMLPPLVGGLVLHVHTRWSKNLKVGPLFLFFI